MADALYVGLQDDDRSIWRRRAGSSMSATAATTASPGSPSTRRPGAWRPPGMRRPRRSPPRSVWIRRGRSCSPRERRPDVSPHTGSMAGPARWSRWKPTPSDGGPRRCWQSLSAVS